MRTLGLSLGAVVLAAPLVVAAPAQADHNVDAWPGGCYWGPYAALGFELSTDKVSFERDEEGRLTGYTCHFAVPAYVSAEDSAVGEEWNLPRRPMRRTDSFPCSHAEWAGAWGSGSFLITPGGRGHVRCVFDWSQLE